MTRIRSGQINSQTATDGYVLTADGSGNAAWEAAAGAPTAAEVRDAGRWEVIVDGTAPPVAVTNEAEDDWLYGWITG